MTRQKMEGHGTQRVLKPGDDMREWAANLQLAFDVASVNEGYRLVYALGKLEPERLAPDVRRDLAKAGATTFKELLAAVQSRIETPLFNFERAARFRKLRPKADTPKAWTEFVSDFRRLGEELGYGPEKQRSSCCMRASCLTSCTS